MFEKINISRIVKDHVGTMVHPATNKAASGDYITFLVLPLVIATILIGLRILLTNDLVDILIGALSIFVGLLLNVLVIVYDLVKKSEPVSQTDTARNTVGTKTKSIFLKHIFSNISFSILLSLITIVFLLFTYLDNKQVKFFFNFISYFMLIEFLLTLLMVLKRVHTLLLKEFGQ